MGRNSAQQYPQRHGHIQLCATLCTKNKQTTFFSSVFIGQLKIKFSVGSMLNRSVQQMAKKTAELQAEENFFFKTRDCIRGNFRSFFMANPPLAAYFNLQLKEGNKKSAQPAPTNHGPSFRTSFSKIVLPRRRTVTRGDFTPAALIVLRSYCYFSLYKTHPPIML